jgi:hypothetical protein
MATVGAMLTQIVSNFSPSVLFEFIAGYSTVLFLMAIGYVGHFIPDNIVESAQERMMQMPLYAKALCVVVVIVVVIQTKSAEVQPFIYFQF